MLQSFRLVFGHAGLRITTIALFCLGFTYASTMPYQSIVAINELGFSAQSFGLILISTALMSTFGTVVLGHFSDGARDRKQQVLLSLSAGAIGFSIFSIWPTPWTFLICLFIFMPVANAAFPQLFAVIRTLTDDAGGNAASVNSVIRAIFAGSWIVVPGLVGLYIAWTGRASDAYRIAALAYVFCLALYWVFGPSGGGTHENQSQATLFEALRLILSGRIFSKIFSLALIGIAHPVNAVIMPLIILQLVDGSVTDVGLIAGLVAGLEIPFMLLGGALVRRVPVVWILIGGGLCHVVYMLALIGVTSVTHIYLLAVVNAAGAAILLSMHISYLQDSMPDRPGLGTALSSVERLIQQGLSAMVVAGIGLLFGFTGALVIAAFGGLAGIVLLMFSDRRAPQQV